MGRIQVIILPHPASFIFSDRFNDYKASEMRKIDCGLGRCRKIFKIQEIFRYMKNN